MNSRTDPPPPPTHRHHLGHSHLTKLDPSPMDRVNNTDKHFFIYEEIQIGSGAKPYMRNVFLIYEECIYCMTLQPIRSKFYYI
jgi:hypothetical protein